MKFYEIEFLKNNHSYKQIIRAKNLNSAQAKALSRNWKIIHIQEFQKFHFVRLKDENFIFFFKELALLCEAGLSVQEGIKQIYLARSCKIIKRVLDNLILAQNLNQAFKNAYFGLNSAELALIHMAENTGKISEVFRQIASLRQKSMENKKQIKKALRYPILVFLSTIGAFLFLMLFVMPNFKDWFESLDVELPLITHIMLQSYNFLKIYGVVFLAFFIFLFFTILLCYKYFDSFALYCDFLFLKLPLFSRLILYNQNHYFFIVFSLLLKSGISISKAFYLASSALGNRFLMLKYQKILVLLDGGFELSQAFKQMYIVDSLVFSMLNIAMKSAKLELLSEEIDKYYEQKSQNIMEQFLVLLEPVMTLFVAFLVLFLALGIFLPMWELSAKMHF